MGCPRKEAPKLCPGTDPFALALYRQCHRPKASLAFLAWLTRIEDPQIGTCNDDGVDICVDRPPLRETVALRSD